LGPEVNEFNLLTRLSPRLLSAAVANFGQEAMGLCPPALVCTIADAGKYPDQLLRRHAAAGSPSPKPLSTKPRILLLDEAFRRGSDPGHAQGHATPHSPASGATPEITVLFVTHNTQEALYLKGSRVIVAGPRESTGTGAPAIALELPVPELCPEVPDFHHGSCGSTMLPGVPAETR